nr:hypothetical protein B0A51_00363 [Rachicladosporium sp. CCFEE 5018]
MEPDTPTKSMNKYCKSIKKSGFDQQQNSDIIIQTSERSIFAHKAVLCLTKYFRDNFDILPGSEHVILLLDDPASAIVALLQHLYGIDYKLSDDFAASGIWLTPHVQVCITADKYQIPKLAVLAEQEIETILDKRSPLELIAKDFCSAARIVFGGVTGSNRYLHKTAVDQQKYSDITINYSGRSVFAHKVILRRRSVYFRKIFDNFKIIYHDMLAHTQIYIAADKYCCEQLRLKALEHIADALHERSDIGQIIGAQLYHPIRIAFEHTLSTDTGIRPLFRRFCADNIHELRRQTKFADLLRDVPELSMALVLGGERGSALQAVHLWRCEKCKYVVSKDALVRHGAGAGTCRCGVAPVEAAKRRYISFVEELGVFV